MIEYKGYSIPSTTEDLKEQIKKYTCKYAHIMYEDSKDCNRSFKSSILVEEFIHSNDSKREELLDKYIKEVKMYCDYT